MSEIYKSKPLVRVLMLKGADGASSKTSELINDSGYITEQEAITLVTNIIESGSVGDIDTGFVTTVKEQNHGVGLKFWVGTKAEYDALLELKSDTYYIVKDYSEIDAKIAEAKAEIEQDFSNYYEDEIAAINTQVATNTEDIAELQELPADHESRITTLEGKVNTAEGDINGLETSVSGLNTRLTTAEGNIGANSSAISNLNTEVSGVKSDLYKTTLTDGGTLYLTGVLTNNKGEIDFVIPTSCLTLTDRTIDTTTLSFYVKVRQNGSYIIGDGSTEYDILTIGSVSASPSIFGIKTRLYISSSFAGDITAKQDLANAVNNEVVSIALHNTSIGYTPA